MLYFESETAFTGEVNKNLPLSCLDVVFSDLTEYLAAFILQNQWEAGLKRVRVSFQIFLTCSLKMLPLYPFLIETEDERFYKYCVDFFQTGQNGIGHFCLTISTSVESVLPHTVARRLSFK